jgi:signal peptidase I
MKKKPSRVSARNARDGLLYFDATDVSHGKSTLSIWVDRADAPEDSNVLITVSHAGGEVTTLISRTSITETSAKDFVRTPEERANVITSKWVTRTSLLIKGLGYSLLGILLAFSALSATGVVKARVVLTGSMAPSINPGDIVITANPNRVLPHIGSVVAYQARTFDGRPVGVFSHRIISGNESDGYLMKGDHNPSPDIQRPKKADILGTVVFVIPWIGKFLTKQALFFLLPIIVGIWVAFDALKEAPIEE